MVGTGTLQPFLEKVDKQIKNKRGKFTRAFRREVREFLKSKDRPINNRTKKRAQAKLRARKARQMVPKSQQISGFQSDAAHQVIYGRMRVGGVITNIETTNKNRELHLIITVAGHQIDSINDVYFDDVRIVFGGTFENPDPGWSQGSQRPDDPAPNTSDNAPFRNKVFFTYANGSNSQAAIPEAVANMSTWTTNHRQRGCAHVYLILKYDGLLFEDGIPDITFDINGKAVYDPRTLNTTYSRNAALILADVLRDSRFGLSQPLTALDLAGISDAADICDELVDRHASTFNPALTEERYTIDGSFDTDLSPGEIIEEMLTALGNGRLTYVEGLWNIVPGKYRAPTITLTEDDLLGPLRVITKNSRRDTFNSVRGTYVSEDAGFEATEFPVVNEPTFVSQDNAEIFEEISYPFTTSSSGVQRLAKMDIRKIKQEVFAAGEFNLKALQLAVGDTVNIQNSRLGWEPKVFEVNDATIGNSSGGDGQVYTVKLDLQETAVEVYDFQLADILTQDPSPNTTLPNPFEVAPPTNMLLESGTDQLIPKGDGSILSSIRVSWDAPDDGFVENGGEIEVEFKKTSDPDVPESWRFVVRVPAQTTFANILEVEDGVAYDVRIRSRNGIGAFSDYVRLNNHVVVGKTEPPTAPTGLSATFNQFGIRLDWQQIEDLDLSHYEIRLGVPGDTFSTAEFLAEVSGTSFTLETRSEGTYVFFIKSVDTSKNFSVASSELEVVITGPELVTGLGVVIDGPDYVLRWNDVPPTIFQVEQYLIYYGDDFNTAIFVTATKSTSFRQKVLWGGVRRFWLVAQDVAGNLSPEVSIDVNITVPGAVRQLSVEVVDNNVLLRWLEPSVHSLPIDSYEVLKNTDDDFGTAESLGFISGTFQTVFEIISGTYYYWVRAKDSAGNLGPERQVVAVVDEPPDFEIFDDQFIDPATADSLINMTVIETDPGINALIGPILTGLTWEDYFNFYGFSTVQDRINGGYPFYGQPNAQWGYFEKVIDYGVVIPPTLIKITFIQQILAGTLNINTTIGYSLDGINYTEVENVSQIFASNFQFVRIKVLIGCPPGTVAGQTMGLLLALTYDGTTQP